SSKEACPRSWSKYCGLSICDARGRLGREAVMGEVAASAQRIRNVLLERGFSARSVRGTGEASRYEELTGVAAPPEVVELWSVLGGVDVAGMWLVDPDSAGQACAARAREGEEYGPG